MDTSKRGKYFYYVLSVLFLIIGLSGINRLIIKADLPFSYSYQDNTIISTEKYDAIDSGDVVFSVEDIEIKSAYQLETILDSKSIGHDANVEILSAGNSNFKPNIHLAHYYDNLNFILISFLVGLSFWITSVFLIMKKYGDRCVTSLFWVLMLFAIATMTSPGRYFNGTDWIGYTVRVSHVTSYFLGAIIFLHFTFIFPQPRIKRLNIFTSILYSISFLFCITLITVQLFSITGNASGWIFTMEKLWELTEAVLLISIISGALNLYLYYRTISESAGRKKTEWIFWGLAAGAGPFLLMWLVPRLIGLKEIIPEELLLAFLVLVPVFFAMAVVKYHVFEIEIFIKQSILYFTLIVIIVIIYEIAISVIAFIAVDLIKEHNKLVTISIILLESFIFAPIQNKVRKFIDRIFYREKYNFENAVSNFSAGIKEQSTILGLSKYVITEIEKIIPVKKIALIAATEKADRLKILSQNNFNDLSEYLSVFKVKPIKSEPNKIIAVKEKTEPGIDIDDSMSELLKKWEINIVIPFTIESKSNAGAILLGDKLSGLRYMKQDIEILKVLISNLILAFKKLQLQEKVMLEELKISKLEEFNKKMTYYVSSVSHDLKTPLTSIKMFTEILKEQNVFKNGNANEYLDIIEGESDRLSRLINNVLNYSKIENGIKEYSFERINLNQCIIDVLKIMEYQFMMENFKIEMSLQENIFIIADKDAVKEVLINLFTNAIKYSLENKIIRISSKIKNEFAVIEIEDEGIGISQEDIRSIFDPFIRLKNSNIKHTGGAGIGLSIVKNIIDVHKGSIEVESTLGKGSSFILYFPMIGD